MISVIGAGAWGTTLSLVLYRKGLNVILWTRTEDLKRSLIKHGENKKYLSGISIPKEICITTDLEEAVKKGNIIIIAVPSPFFKNIFQKIVPFAKKGVIFVSVTKGFDEDSYFTPCEVMEKLLPPEYKDSIGVISGPNLAREIANKLPAVTVAGSKNIKVARRLKQIFQTDYFRVLQTSDIKGVEIGGALKNIFAIAAGIATGLGFGSNTFAAILTGGFTEMYSFGVKLGARFDTFLTPAGIGDLFTTCSSSLSRNKTLGLELSKGRNLEDILSGMNSIVEGVNTTRIAYELSHKYKIDMPIAREVYKVFTGEVDPYKAVQNVMTKGYAETVYNIPCIEFSVKN